MSTRSQLRFVDSSTEWSDAVQVYRHSDGYPKGVLPDLRQLRDLQNRTGTARGATYTAANFILLQKLRGMKMYVGDAPPMSDGIDIEDVLDPESWDLSQPHFLLGYGVENPASGIHGDEEYLYVVDVADEWEVSVSEHGGFPTWDANDELPDEETAFDHAEWQFDGISLDGAIEALADE